jgi:ADP-ribose pyrophosphatase
MDSPTFKRLNDWVDLGQSKVRGQEDYYFLRVPDYIFVICIGNNQEVPLVCQYRLPLEKLTLELPAGLIEFCEPPHVAGVREAREEVGLLSFANSRLLGPFSLDTGRLQNETYLLILYGCEFDLDYKGEEEINIYWTSVDNLVTFATSSRIDHLGQVATILLSHELGLLRNQREE